MAAIYYYCGNPAPVWDAILSLPYDALSLGESKKGFRIDIEEVVDRIGGRACVLGNLDAITLLEHASEAALRAEIGRQIRAGRRNGSRFIMSIGSPVTPGTSAERG
jgi:uroporphyrinogen-III decarboxylase